MPAIAGFAAAATIAAQSWASEAARLKTLRDDLEKQLRAAVRGIEFVGADAPRLANTSVFALPGVKAETAVIAFDLAGVCVSSGAACSSGKVRRSRVLEAMGASPLAMDGAVRASFGWASTQADVDALVAAATKIAANARAKELS